MSDPKILKLPAALIEMIYNERQTPFPPSWKRDIYEFVETVSIPENVLRGRLIIKREGDCSWWGITYPLAQNGIKPWAPIQQEYPDDLELHLMIRREKVTYTWHEA